MSIEIIKDASVRIDPTVKIFGTGKIILGPKVQIRAYAVIEIDGTLEIGDQSVIGYHDFIQCSGDMKIGKGTLVGPNTVMLASSHRITNVPLVNEKMRRSFLTIGDNVWVGANCTINHGIVIGNNAIIGANSFVNKSVSADSIVGGVPAKLLRTRN